MQCTGCQRPLICKSNACTDNYYSVFSCVVAAVYDSTLNFRNNEMPTLLGILKGKKYHADLYVRSVAAHAAFHILFGSDLLLFFFFIVYLRDLNSLLVCRRIPLEVIPEDEAECAAWLHKLYQEKVRVC